MMKRLAFVLALTLVACGGTSAPVKHAGDADDSGGGPFADRKFTPRSFAVDVTGEGRPVIFIPGLGCPGEVWTTVVDHLSDHVEAHVLTLAGFAGQKPIKPPLAATVRKELVRYIRSHRLTKPILVGHSMGGFIAYWVAATAPDLVGGVIVVDAGPALGDTDVETAKTLRNAWAAADADDVHSQVSAAYRSMATDPKKIEPYLDAIEHSDPQTMGDAIYELVTTDLTDKVDSITAPLLLILADGGYQGMYKAQVKDVPDHAIVVLPKTRHFVWFDDLDGFNSAVDKFLASHPAS